jgi:hypothetical protein
MISVVAATFGSGWTKSIQALAFASIATKQSGMSRRPAING